METSVRLQGHFKGPAEESREADCLRSAARTAEAAVSPAASKAGTYAAVRTADDEKRAANQRSPYGMPATAGRISRRGNLFHTKRNI